MQGKGVIFLEFFVYLWELKWGAMIFIRYILLIFCLLVGGVGASAQGLTSDLVEWDFGTIAEEGGTVSHRFVLRNGSSDAVVVRSVRTSCGCTTSEYTRRPIASGGEGELVVTFDPRFRPGHFSKDIYIYSTAATEPLVVKIVGSVTPRVESLAERYPYTLGRDSVRISMLYLSVAPLMEGELVLSSAEFTNATSRPIEIEFRPRRESEELHLFYDRGVAAGERTVVEVGYRVDDATNVRRDTLDIFVDGVAVDKSIFIRGGAE